MKVPANDWAAQLPWLKTLPSGWRVVRFGRVASISTRDNIARDDRLLSLSTVRGIIPKVYDDDNRVRTGEDLRRYWMVRPGQLVINPMWLAQGSIAVSGLHGVISPDYRVYSLPDSLEPRYISYLLKSEWYRGLYQLFIRGETTYDRRVSKDSFHGLPVVVPPVSEQRAIADFLDRKVSGIDVCAVKVDELICLLKEKRRALSAYVVTNGLCRDAKFQASGVPWIGLIPAHWRLLRLKYISPRISGRLVYQPAQYFSDEGVPFLMGNNITERGISWTNVKRIPLEINVRFSHHALREGDVVTVRVGAPGLTCVVPKEADGLNCGSLMIVRRSPCFESRWLAYVMNSSVVRSQIDLVQYGAAQEQINITDAVGFFVPTPPLDEQRQIADHLDMQVEMIDRSTDLLTAQNEALREYRQALITAAVTGQLDVTREPS